MDLRNIAIIAHVDQRGLAVVDMGNNGDIAQIHSAPVHFARILEMSRAPKGPRLAKRI